MPATAFGLCVEQGQVEGAPALWVYLSFHRYNGRLPHFHVLEITHNKPYGTGDLPLG